MPIDGAQLSCSCPSGQSDEQAVCCILSLHLVLLRVSLSYDDDYGESGFVKSSQVAIKHLRRHRRLALLAPPALAMVDICILIWSKR